MSSAGKWVLGLLLLVVGAVAVARTVSNNDDSQAVVKNLPAAQSAANASAAAAAADSAKKAGPATDLACKKACVDEPEVSEGAITTQKIAPGSVTLSKLAFEVPNLNELENEINARKAAEAAAIAARDGLASETAKNDAAITAAAQNGLTAEAAARTAALDKITKDYTAADASIVSSLNNEIGDRSKGDDDLQLALNTEIASRKGAIDTLSAQLADPTEVASPIVKVNNNEIVDDAVTVSKLADNSVGTAELINESILSEDIKDGEVKSADIGNGEIQNVNIAGDAVTSDKISPNTIGVDDIGTGAVKTDEIFDGTILVDDVDTGSLDGFFASDTELATEAGIRSAADTAEATARANADTAEATARSDADTAEAATRGAADTLLQNFDASLGTVAPAAGTAGTPALKVPNSSDALVEWSRLKGVPTGFADNVDDDGGTKVTQLANDLKADDGTANEGSDLVSFSKVKDLTVAGGDGAITGQFLKDGTVDSIDLAPNAVTFAKINKGDIRGEAGAGAGAGTNGNIALKSITRDNIANFTLQGGQDVVATPNQIADGSVTAFDLANDAVTVDKLAADVDTLLATLRTDVDAATTRLDNLATSGAAAAGVHTTNLAGASVTTVVVPATPAINVSPGRQELILVVTGIADGDFVSVSPPALPGGMIFAGARITGANNVTAYIYNPTGGAVDVAGTSWVVNWMDLTP